MKGRKRERDGDRNIERREGTDKEKESDGERLADRERKREREII